MALTTEQIELLDQILVNGYAVKTVPILGGKAEITFKSMTAANQLEVESFMKNIEGPTAFVVHTYSIKLLSRVIVKYHVIGKDPIIFTDPAAAESFLKTSPSTVVDAVIAAQGAFEKMLTTLAQAENLEVNFTPTPSPEYAPAS